MKFEEPCPVCGRPVAYDELNEEFDWGFPCPNRCGYLIVWKIVNGRIELELLE